jgi:Ca-activated chloride channel family protein
MADAEAGMSTWLATLPAVHFIRPQWLWALLALPLLGWWWRSRQQRASAWRGIVDPHLLPHLLEAGSDRRTHAALAGGMLACALSVLALAGPAWRKVEQPLWQTSAPLVIALDLSSAALANDLPPSRLLQARAKLATLLRERKGGQVALVAYAGDAFTVAPLTDDAGNVALFLDVLAPDVMPVDGQRADRAIAVSMRLLEQAGADRGDILLLSDHADAAAHAYAASAVRAGYRVSALGVGRAAGAPYRARDGRIGQARLDEGSLRTLAGNGNGRYVTLTADVADLRALGVLDPQQADNGTGSNRGRAGASWQDEGYWLLPPLMLLALFVFRRGGAGVALLVLCIVLPVRAQNARVEGTPWRRADQVAHARMEQGVEAYRKGDFARAASAYDGLDGADAHYNRGNALAKQGRYEDAISAYDRALRLEPGMADALANKRAVEAAMKRKPPPGQQDGGDKQDQQQKSQGGQQGQPSDDSKKQQPGQPSDGKQSQGTPPRGETPQAEPRARPSAEPPAKPGDAKSQQTADAAQRARMQQALAQAKQGQQRQDKAQVSARTETPAERERRLANEAWLQRVPDDPGGLLRAKFRLEYERRQREGGQ